MDRSSLTYATHEGTAATRAARAGRAIAISGTTFQQSPYDLATPAILSISPAVLRLLRANREAMLEVGVWGISWCKCRALFTMKPPSYRDATAEPGNDEGRRGRGRGRGRKGG